ncbi:DUF4357 domain-containing protein [Geothermobacter hydrogeniphilus]|uniref:DUF4357 domain-containing protein n=1 Tax=Geothermobacter hydrogeniphilus TaxID=1969733 RepID=UPI0011AF59BC|nr:DUF4357 domain-containing protein [Geothermobacter hydrogeniphilus]
MSSAKKSTASWGSYCNLRGQFVIDSKPAPSDTPAFYVFTDDVAFSNPSAVGTVVAARNTNGRES